MARFHFALLVCVTIHQVLSQGTGSGSNSDSRYRLYSALRLKREAEQSTYDFEDRIGNPVNKNNHTCQVTKEVICIEFLKVPRWSAVRPTCLKNVTAVKCMQEVNCWVDELNGYHSKCVQQTDKVDGKEYPNGCVCELHANKSFKRKSRR